MRSAATAARAIVAGVFLILRFSCCLGGRVIKGEIVTKKSPANFPFHLQIGPVARGRLHSICGGSLISSKYANKVLHFHLFRDPDIVRTALTAAHCVQNTSTCRMKEELLRKRLTVVSGMFDTFHEDTTLSTQVG